MTHHDVMAFSAMPLPTANQYVYLCDSTKMLVEPLTPSTTIATAGSYRAMWAGARVDFYVGCTTQDVTLVRQQLDSAGNWGTIASGSQTITAAAAYTQISWLPNAPDFRVYVLAGGTAPATLLSGGSLTRGDRASGS